MSRHALANGFIPAKEFRVDVPRDGCLPVLWGMKKEPFVHLNGCWMKTLFVTGASGFVGRMLIEKLAGRSFETIYCLTRTGKIGLSDRATRQKITVIKGDLLDPGGYAEYLASSDTVLHMAAVTGKAKPEGYFEVNAEGTRLLVRQCERLGVKNLLYVSTIAVKFPDISNYFYAQSKKMGEDAVTTSSLRYTIVRPTMVIGNEGAIWLNLAKLANAPFPVIFGRGETRIQPVYVGDLVNVLMSVIEEEIFENNIYDVGGPEIVRFGDFIEMIRLEYGRKSRPLLHLPLGLLLKILVGLENYVYSFLPINAGQLSSFVYESVGEPNRLHEQSAPAMSSPREMVQKVIQRETQDRYRKGLYNECRAFCRYLLDTEPTEYVSKKYCDAHHQKGRELDLSSALFDRILGRLSQGNRLCTGLVDAYTRMFCKRSIIRKKLILVLAILESTHPYCEDTDSVNCSSRAGFFGMVFCKVAFFAVRCMVSAIVLAPVQVASAIGSKLRSQRS